MELSFNKNDNGAWVAEFEATSDFNLHIEGVVEGNVRVYQRSTASGGYAYVRDATPYPSYSNVYDMDFAGLVYPKLIKVVCATEPTLALVASDGEVTEIKSQSKEIEVTSNGTTVVEPDAGFAYLNKVSVKTNVEQSGGNGGGIKYTYYNFRGWMDNGQPPMAMQVVFMACAFLSITIPDKDKAIMPTYIAMQNFSQQNLSYVNGVAIDYNAPMKAQTGELVNMKQYILGMGVQESDLNALKEISEEEFLALG